MVKHIVCFKIKDEYKCDLQKIAETLEASKIHVKEVIEMKVGINFLESPRNYDLVLESVFNNQEEAEIYQQHPYHVETVGKLMKEVTCGSVAVDYEF